MRRNDRAFDELYSHYRGYVEAYVRRRTRPDAVDDVVAEVFAVAWRRRADLPANGLPWLYRTAWNVIGDRYRADDRRSQLLEKLRTVPAEEPATLADGLLDRSELIAAFGTLTDDEREVLLLHAWEGLTNGDIGHTLGISSGAAAVRLHRARRRLQRALASPEPEQVEP